MDTNELIAAMNAQHAATLAATAAKEDALKSAHPAEYAAGREVGVKDGARWVKSAGAYDDDTNPPAELSGKALEAWYLGWDNGARSVSL